ncbi:nop14-like family protein [Cystoisospora suis]|uniref:Nop14-like family protein n=1 Tax=Cystoisospora suis TaxID=483139 RepID=A0A2C6L7T6_9APIC|nr:nop14-like family protein [Cystoisospora suis]
MKMSKKRKEGGGGPSGGNSDARAGKVSRNAFEVLGNKKLRREVAGRKVKGSERNLVSSAEKDRKQRMKVLYNSVFDVAAGSSARSSDSFRDERWASSFGSVGEEDEKALLKRLRLLAKRREKERVQKGGRKKGFALADEDDDQGEGGLTHGGVPLAALGDTDLEDKDRDGLLGDNLTGELEGEGDDMEFPPDLFFKEGATSGQDGEGEERPKTRREIYREIIAHSKEARARLACEQRQQRLLLEKLDEDFSDLLVSRSDMFRPTKKQALEALMQKHVGGGGSETSQSREGKGIKQAAELKQSESPPSEPKTAVTTGKSTEAKNVVASGDISSTDCPLFLSSSPTDTPGCPSTSAPSSSVSAPSFATKKLAKQIALAADFDALAASLHFDRRLPGTDRLLSAEEAREKKKKELEKKEKERQERMLRGEEEQEEAATEGQEQAEGGDDEEEERHQHQEESEQERDTENSEDEDSEDEDSDGDDESSDEDKEAAEAKELLEESSSESEGDGDTDERRIENASHEGEAGENTCLSTRSGKEVSCSQEGFLSPEPASKEESRACERDREDEIHQTGEEKSADRLQPARENGRAGKGDRGMAVGSRAHGEKNQGGGEEDDEEEDDEFMDEEEKQARQWMRNGKGEETLTFKPQAPLTKEDARTLLGPYPLRSQWKLLHRLRVLLDSEGGTSSVSCAPRGGEPVKEQTFKALLGYALDAHISAASCGEGPSLVALWSSLSEHYLFFAQDHPEVLYSFFLPLLANIAARTWPATSLHEDLQHAFRFAPAVGGPTGDTTKTKESSSTGARAESATWIRDDTSLPYPLLSSGALSEGRSAHAKTSPPPTVADLAVIQLLFFLCPLTDYKHPLLSPSLLLLDFFASKLSAFPLFLTDNPTRPLRPGVKARSAQSAPLRVPELDPAEEDKASGGQSEGHSGSGEEHGDPEADRLRQNPLAGRPLGMKNRKVTGDDPATDAGGREEQVVGSALPPVLPLSRVAVALQVLSLQHQVQAASGRYMPSSFSLAIALLRTAIENLQERSIARAQRKSEKATAGARLCGTTDAKDILAETVDVVRVVEAVIATLRSQARELAEACSAGFVPLSHILLPAFPFLHESLLVAVTRTSSASGAAVLGKDPEGLAAVKKNAGRDEQDGGIPAVDCQLKSSPLFPLLEALRELWRACLSILSRPLVPLSLYHKAEKIGLTLLTPRYVEPSLLRRKCRTHAGRDDAGAVEAFEEIRREKRQANEMRRQVGRMLRRDAAFVQAAKGKADMHRKKRNADRQREILGILEQDQVEYKKLKTTGGTMDTSLAAYRPSKRTKKRRMAGNRQEGQSGKSPGAGR